MNKDEPTTWGALSSQGVPVIASTASAPPTPIASIPRPPAFGVCESTDLGFNEGPYNGRFLIAGAKPGGDNGKLGRSTIVRAISHEHPRSSIILKDDLMDNSRARSPELNPVLFGRAL